MRLSNDITVDAPAEALFSFVTDIERVATCLPGARIEASDGDEYRGSMRVKVGPITADYRGTVELLELDPAARRAVLHARADDTAGQGQAEARIVTAIEEVDGGSRMRMDTDLQIRGRVAQFGRGVMDKVANRLFAEFARNVEAAITGDGSVPPSPSAPDSAPPAPMDLTAGFARPDLRRFAPVIVSALVGFGYGYLAGKLRERLR